MNKAKRAIWIASLMLSLPCSLAVAQSLGTINGRVTDQTGAVVAGAAVTATNAGTGIARDTITTSEGDYSIAALTPGIYNVSVNAAGFAKSEKLHETLVTGTTLTVSFALGVAAASQNVEVTSDIPLVELTQSMPAGTLQTSEVESLPVLNRSMSSLVSLVPGTHLSSSANGAKSGEVGGVSFSGGNGRSGAMEVDGGVFRDDVYGGSLYNLTLEGVQEFSVLSHDYGAQYGMTSGGIALITTKSGTNTWHGSAFAFGRSQSMTAIDYFSEPANGGLGKPPYDREQWGGSLGLPIIKDKLFVFGAFERTTEDIAALFTSTFYQQTLTLKSALTGLTNCTTCVLIGNAITPSPFVPGTVGVYQITGRMDYQINSRHSLFFRWIDQHVNNYNTNNGTDPDIDPNGSNYTEKSPADSGLLSEIWVINNKTVNTAAITANHLAITEGCHCTLTGADLVYRNISFPGFSVGGGANTGNPATVEVETLLQFKDTLARQAGNHALKLGGDYIYFPRIGTSTQANAAGTAPSVAFFDLPSVIVGNTNGLYPQGFLTPGAMSSEIVSSYALGGGPSVAYLTGIQEWSLFAQDDWKIKPSLTLDLGMRYSMDINFKNESEQNLNRSLLALKAIGSPFGGTIHRPNLDLSPRVGFAWNPGANGKNVFRGSFGIYFDEALIADSSGAYSAEQPYLNNLASTYTNTSVGHGQLATAVYGQSALLQGPLPNTTSYTPGAGTSLTWFDPNVTDPRSVQWHAGYTRQLTPSVVVSADYTYILGLKEFHNQSINPTESLNWDPNAAQYLAPCSVSPTVLPTRRLECAFRAAGYPTPNTFGAVSTETTGGLSKYKDLTIHLEQRNRHVTLQGTYTLSYAYAFGGAVNTTTGGGAATASEIPFQWQGPGEWGASGDDERHRGVVSAVVNLPWTITASPIFQAGSARPYSCAAGVDWTGSGFGTGARCIINSSGTLITAKGLAVPFPAGDSAVPVNYLRGTPTWDLDTRFTKTFSIRERLKANLFAELYNITGKANFGNTYGGTFTATTFEQPTGYFNGGQSLPTSRQLQLGARFTF